jgi:hypothetical protein
MTSSLSRFCTAGSFLEISYPLKRPFRLSSSLSSFLNPLQIVTKFFYVPLQANVQLLWIKLVAACKPAILLVPSGYPSSLSQPSSLLQATRPLTPC